MDIDEFLRNLHSTIYPPIRRGTSVDLPLQAPGRCRKSPDLGNY